MLRTAAARLEREAAPCARGRRLRHGRSDPVAARRIALDRRRRETEALAASLDDNGGVYFVPAFVGLGSPHWRADARGTITGLSRGTSRAQLVRAALEATAFQTADVLDAMPPLDLLRADGGMTRNRWLMQFQADVLGVPVETAREPEQTALGAALLALGERRPSPWESGSSRAAPSTAPGGARRCGELSRSSHPVPRPSPRRRSPAARLSTSTTDADGNAKYEAHMTKADGTPVTVYVDANYNLVSVQTRP